MESIPTAIKGYERTSGTLELNETSSAPEVGPWAKEKLDALGKYLNAYTKILRRQTQLCLKGYVYIDAFAGTGRAKIRGPQATEQLSFSPLGFPNIEDGEETFIEGSPRVALGIKHPFTHYVFIEEDEQRCRSLKNLRRQHSDKKIYIRNCDCNAYLQKLMNRMDRNKWRGVIFLDPYGTHVSWETVRVLGERKLFEIFVNFPLMAINRLSYKIGEEIPANYRNTLNAYFGSEEWFRLIYKKRTDMFDSVGYTKKQNAAKILTDFYKQKLRSKFQYVSAAHLICNSKHSPLYCLIWAGHNQTGYRIADYVLSQGEAV